MELLAPAGSFEAAKAAVSAGADAIYMGGPLFSARAYADSSRDGKDPDILAGDPERDPLLKSIRFCHLHGVRVYMTLNTLMKEAEFRDLSLYLRPYVSFGVDAFIVQDLGLMKWLKENYPEVPLHVSTQAAVTGPRYAGKLLKFGAVRVVPARELSLAELKRIADTGIQVEAFIHGALCYSYSGQCLMSSFIGCRSGNRGRCAGTCRLPVELYSDRMIRLGEEGESYLLSMKDLCTVSRLGELRRAGVCSLKIEGRMKSPSYVAGVTSVYRKALDALERESPESIDLTKAGQELGEIFDRGGFSDAYLDGRNGRDALVLTEKEEHRVPDPKLMERIRSRYLDGDPKIRIRVSGTFEAGKEACLRMETVEGNNRVCVKGPLVQEAARKPVTEEELKEKILAFGESSFEPAEASFQTGGNIFIPLGALKELRRHACEELEKSILAGFGGNAGAV